jgi:hypothetical protein
MTSSRSEALKQLVEALATTDTGNWSAAALARLHAKALPAARCLVPIDDRLTLLLSGVERGHVLVPSTMTNLDWLLLGLKEQHFTSRAATQQACELLCALSDVLYASLAADSPEYTTANTSRHRRTCPTFVKVMQQPYAGEAMSPRNAHLQSILQLRCCKAGAACSCERLASGCKVHHCRWGCMCCVYVLRWRPATGVCVQVAHQIHSWCLSCFLQHSR